MRISEVKVKLVPPNYERLLAFCLMTIEGCFVVRDMKLIEGDKGFFVAMPSRKLCDKCPSCYSKNHLRANFCNNCGGTLAQDRVIIEEFSGKKKLHADIAHPINSYCRKDLHEMLIKAYQAEFLLAQQPGYICRYEDVHS